MDNRTGKILSQEEIDKFKQMDLEKLFESMHFVSEMQIPPTLEQQRNRKVGRNDPCPCGSGIKFKKCCLGKAAKHPYFRR